MRRRAPQTLDTRLLGPFPLQKVSRGELPIQEVRSSKGYSHTSAEASRVLRFRAGRFCSTVLKRKREMLEEFRCTPDAELSNMRLRERHDIGWRDCSEPSREQSWFRKERNAGGVYPPAADSIQRKSAGGTSKLECWVHWRGLSRRLNRRIGSGSSKLCMVLEEKTLRGLSAGRRNDKSIKRPAARASLVWSGREDSNLRPLRPERSALPGCATPRQNHRTTKRTAIVLHQGVETQAMGIGDGLAGHLPIHHVHAAR